MKTLDFIVNAQLMYRRYLETQAKITAIEQAAFNAAQGNSRAAAHILLNPMQETEQSFIYASLCGDRDQYMKRAQLDATMAIMLRAAE